MERIAQCDALTLGSNAQDNGKEQLIDYVVFDILDQWVEVISRWFGFEER